MRTLNPKRTLNQKSALDSEEIDVRHGGTGVARPPDLDALSELTRIVTRLSARHEDSKGFATTECISGAPNPISTRSDSEAPRPLKKTNSLTRTRENTSESESSDYPEANQGARTGQAGQGVSQGARVAEEVQKAEEGQQTMERKISLSSPSERKSAATPLRRNSVPAHLPSDEGNPADSMDQQRLRDSVMDLNMPLTTRPPEEP